MIWYLPDISSIQKYRGNLEPRKGQNKIYHFKYVKNYLHIFMGFALLKKIFRRLNNV